MSLIASAFWLMAIVGCLYTLAALACLIRFACQPGSEAIIHPTVTVLKPLHGDEPLLFDNLASVLRQTYAGAVSVICGVADAADPAVDVVERLRAAFPDADLRLVVDGRRHGRNGKVSNLINMSREIAGDVVVLADSDMRVEPNYLSDVVGALQRPGIGAVTCLYRGLSLPNLWSRLATGWVDGQFLPNVVLGLALGMAKPCMGSTIAMTRDTLGRIGGFDAFKDHLADDYEIGAAVRRLGLTVAVPARPVLAHTSASTSLAALLRQEGRWSRTIRAVDPAGFAGSIVTHVLPFAILAALADGLQRRDWVLLGVVLALRITLALSVKRYVRKDTADLILLPLRDVLSFAVFLGSFWPGSIDWRGHRFRVGHDGILTAPDHTGP
ncbi:bacteriohopanetetrol glucosamine biosynthesis glycosyltransferase HpnI [Lichenihabitans sp. Uapishka_5]|uniref:bacteriohopanetetrol glucosamine biosynthesis glycosyltransferase HpnI n=1 Tax=Lichenihabitans sp. Uapishka_5 TaxID=3037302 RepID=UPI0029E7D700|nr:bacteriohopanetetrol glucosamine biosynthesis glycosyltransferase HpnI [Lichenihabitans sp. Uapishka_5]MDX7950093.1 bacteriohopanetetrol glucosamine biosynthesis glycosyltransferase HpnI [Lichenihabitans sp. Uapishka_5]